ncbi:hypothetical protein [Halomonas halocynthiae]|uniref:hypothetical protein n=1 Tax=Halomonas halocynthiae TaxID=176290 RepID=UPI00040AA79C|nr:hypothetical protein [Halomonas halocynthiae]
MKESVGRDVLWQFGKAWLPRCLSAYGVYQMFMFAGYLSEREFGTIALINS